MSIQKSLYRNVFLLSVIPFLLFSFLIMQIYSDRLERVITESLQAVANTQLAEMTNFCSQQERALVLAGSVEVSHKAMKGELGEESLQHLEDMLFSYIEVSEHIQSLTLLDGDYRIVGSTDPNHEEFAGAGMDAVVQSMGEESFYISDILVNQQGEKILVTIAKIEERGQVIGYVLGEINRDFYKGMRKQAEIWNEATFYLLDGKEQIISAGTQQEDREAFVTTEEERKDYREKYDSIDFEKQPKGSFQYKVGRVHYITYYSDVPNTNWRVMLSVNMDAYRTERIIYIALAAFLVLLCVALALLMGRFASKRILQPIRRISNTLNDIQEKQDYSLRAEVSRRDELGVLAEEINALVDFIETEDLYKAQQQRLLQEKAGQDGLTKVFNKERINHHLQEVVKQHRIEGGKIAVLFVDIDDFKTFNTNFGHVVGDQVLLFLASLLRRETGGTVGRAGGDEFLVIVESDQAVEKLEEQLEHVKTAAESQFVVRGSEVCLPIYCCIGVVRVDFGVPEAQELTAERLITLADQAMYRVKNNGKAGHLIVEYPDEAEG